MKFDKDSEDLTPEERAAFGQLSRRKMPPKSLEERIINELRSARLLQPARIFGDSFNIWTFPRLSAVVAAASVLFLLGFALGARRSPGNDAKTLPQSLFALLIYEDDSYAGDPKAQAQEYLEWLFSVNAAGRYVTGQELRLGGRVLRAGDDKIEVRNLNADKTNETIGGFFLIEASGYEDAVQVAKDCPHLKYSGTIEVREIQRQ